MGTNQWKAYNSWPPSNLKQVKFYLHGDHRLKTTTPTLQSDSMFYAYDPKNPSPTRGGATLRSDQVQGPYDQRAIVESRSDNLVFTSDSLDQDLVVKGIIKVNLKVSSDRPDTDFDVRLCDVYPDGRSMLVNDEAFRMRFKNGLTQAQTSFLQIGNVYDCKIELPATCITFLKGHKIRIIISSSNYPKFNRNMNNGNDMYPGKSMDSLWVENVANNGI